MWRAVAWVSCGLLAVSVSFGQEAQLRYVLEGHDGPVERVTFSPNSKTLASVDRGIIILWDVTTGRKKSTLDTDSCAHHALAFSLDGKILAAGVNCQTIWLWDVATSKKIATILSNTFFADPTATFSSLAFRPDGKTLLSWSCDHPGENQAITLWDVATHKSAGAIKVNIDSCTHIAFSPDCRVFAAGGFYRRGDPNSIVELYDATTSKKLATLDGHGTATMDLVFSPDGKTLAAAMNATVKLWDVATGKNTLTLTKGYLDDVSGVAFSPDGKNLASGSLYDSMVELWDVASGKNIATLEGHGEGVSEGVLCVAFSPDGKMLAWGGGWDKLIWLWDLKPTGGKNKGE